MSNMDKYPISKIDRMTVQEMLPIFINKGIFSNYKDLPTKEELKEAAILSSGCGRLTDEDERIILSDAGMYRSGQYVIRDYGKYLIGFSIGAPANHLAGDIVNTLGRMTLNKLGHKLAMILLSEAYVQRRSTDIVISKERLLEYLGYNPREKQIYSQVDNVMFSLMSLNFFMYKFRTVSFSKVKSRELGSFIYNVKSDYKQYTISINENYIGCIADVMNNDKVKRDYGIGYFNYPTSNIRASKDYSTPAYLLSNFLISDSGNSKLNDNRIKVVAYSLPFLKDVMKIESSRISEIKRAFIQAIKEVKMINKTIPSIKDLAAMKPSTLMKQTIHFRLFRDIKQLDGIIQSNLLPAK